MSRLSAPSDLDYFAEFNPDNRPWTTPCVDCGDSVDIDPTDPADDRDDIRCEDCDARHGK